MKIGLRRYIDITLSVLMMLSASACGSGNGEGNDDVGSSDSPMSYAVTLTSIEMTDTRTGKRVLPDGLPIYGEPVSIGPYRKK